MHLPTQKVKKNVVWGRYRDWDNIHFPLYRQLTFLLAGNQFIFCKEEEVVTWHICLIWNVANFMTEKCEKFFRGMLLNGDPGGFVFF